MLAVKWTLIAGQVLGGTTQKFWFDQPTSKVDTDNSSNSPGLTNFVLGAGSGKVYICTSMGTLQVDNKPVAIPLMDFFEVKVTLCGRW
jgi:hypothetical protein